MIIDFDYVLAMELMNRQGVKPCKLLLRKGNPIKVLSWSLRDGDKEYMAIAVESLDGTKHTVCSRDFTGKFYGDGGSESGNDIVMDIDIAQVIQPEGCWIIKDKAGNEYRGVVDHVVGINKVSSWDSCDIVFKWCISVGDGKQWWNVKVNCSWAKRMDTLDREGLYNVIDVEDVYSESNKVALMIANDHSEYFNIMMRGAEEKASTDAEKKIVRNAFLLGWLSRTEWDSYKERREI
jgi:hypothetical protein|nr:MAG TPA: hypothetical protein [Caudoviricetes sp.]